MAGDILVAKATAALTWQGQTVFIQQGVTLAREGHPLLAVAGEMFGPLHVHFDTKAPAPAPAVPEAKTTESPKEHGREQPDAKAVRAWAAENDIDVPARGKLPAEVVEQYLAAQK